MLKKYSIVISIFLFVMSIFSFTTSTKFVSPVNYPYYISSHYGYRYIFDKTSFHQGIDIALPVSTPVYAVLSGTVTYCGLTLSGGNTIIINHKSEYTSMYCHLASNYNVHTNMYVETGDLIGFIGSMYLEDGSLNGSTTGAHLHFGLYKNGSPVNPLDYLP